jgi:hypothetical protein
MVVNMAVPYGFFEELPITGMLTPMNWWNIWHPLGKIQRRQMGWTAPDICPYQRLRSPDRHIYEEGVAVHGQHPVLQTLQQFRADSSSWVKVACTTMMILFPINGDSCCNVKYLARGLGPKEL